MRDGNKQCHSSFVGIPLALAFHLYILILLLSLPAVAHDHTHSQILATGVGSHRQEEDAKAQDKLETATVKSFTTNKSFGNSVKGLPGTC
jgi:hypothetical protein